MPISVTATLTVAETAKVNFLINRIKERMPPEAAAEWNPTPEGFIEQKAQELIKRVLMEEFNEYATIAIQRKLPHASNADLANIFNILGIT